jgi:hypothetical protein
LGEGLTSGQILEEKSKTQINKKDTPSLLFSVNKGFFSQIPLTIKIGFLLFRLSFAYSYMAALP